MNYYCYSGDRDKVFLSLPMPIWKHNKSKNDSEQLRLGEVR